MKHERADIETEVKQRQVAANYFIDLTDALADTLQDFCEKSDILIHDGNGGKPRQEDVFNAFGTMLHEDFSGFQKNLHEACMINNGSKAGENIFLQLLDAYNSYIANK